VAGRYLLFFSQVRRNKPAVHLALGLDVDESGSKCSGVLRRYWFDCHWFALLECQSLLSVVAQLQYSARASSSNSHGLPYAMSNQGLSSSSDYRSLPKTHQGIEIAFEVMDEHYFFSRLNNCYTRETISPHV